MNPFRAARTNKKYRKGRNAAPRDNGKRDNDPVSPLARLIGQILPQSVLRPPKRSASMEVEVGIPLVVWLLGGTNGLGRDGMRSAVMTAAMAPGVNAYLFANMYGAARRVAASAVLIGTGLCILSASFWIAVLP